MVVLILNQRYLQLFKNKLIPYYKRGTGTVWYCSWCPRGVYTPDSCQSTCHTAHSSVPPGRFARCTCARGRQRRWSSSYCCTHFCDMLDRCSCPPPCCSTVPPPAGSSSRRDSFWNGLLVRCQRRRRHNRLDTGTSQGIIVRTWPHRSTWSPRFQPMTGIKAY